MLLIQLVEGRLRVCETLLCMCVCASFARALLICSIYVCVLSLLLSVCLSVCGGRVCASGGNVCLSCDKADRQQTDESDFSQGATKGSRDCVA